MVIAITIFVLVTIAYVFILMNEKTMNIKTEIDKSRAMKAKIREGSGGMNLLEERR